MPFMLPHQSFDVEVVKGTSRERLSSMLRLPLILPVQPLPAAIIKHGGMCSIVMLLPEHTGDV